MQKVKTLTSFYLKQISLHQLKVFSFIQLMILAAFFVSKSLSMELDSLFLTMMIFIISFFLVTNFHFHYKKKVIHNMYWLRELPMPYWHHYLLIIIFSLYQLFISIFFSFIFSKEIYALFGEDLFFSKIGVKEWGTIFNSLEETYFIDVSGIYWNFAFLCLALFLAAIYGLPSAGVIKNHYTRELKDWKQGLLLYDQHFLTLTGAFIIALILRVFYMPWHLMTIPFTLVFLSNGIRYLREYFVDQRMIVKRVRWAVVVIFIGLHFLSLAFSLRLVSNEDQSLKSRVQEARSLGRVAQWISPNLISDAIASGVYVNQHQLFGQKESLSDVDLYQLLSKAPLNKYRNLLEKFARKRSPFDPKKHPVSNLLKKPISGRSLKLVFDFYDIISFSLRDIQKIVDLNNDPRFFHLSEYRLQSLLAKKTYSDQDIVQLLTNSSEYQKRFALRLIPFHQSPKWISYIVDQLEMMNFKTRALAQWSLSFLIAKYPTYQSLSSLKVADFHRNYNCSDEQELQDKKIFLACFPKKLSTKENPHPFEKLPGQQAIKALPEGINFWLTPKPKVRRCVHGAKVRPHLWDS